jgi:DNA-binding CsgD family transcriptional regulator
MEKFILVRIAEPQTVDKIMDKMWKSNKEIGILLMLSEGRIRNIVSDLFEKTGTSDRTQLAVFAVRNDLVD